MANGKIAQKAPFGLELKPGKYFWCACGESANQPYCDGSHKGTEFRPVMFEVSDEGKQLWLCGCKQTGNSPMCDGTHKKL